jgi:tRNA A-37 threonylcarbamoyl transferase component Bud32
MSFNIGETIGPYRIVEQLGQGGMATVYKAYHAALDRYVALKVLHPAFQEDTSFLARFQREARLVAKLEHPNIVPIYDYAEHEGRPYLVMKFIQGETLKARLNTASVTELQVLEVAQAVGAALSYAHKQNILHRDIKPSNVLMAEEGGIYLADFGLARIAQSGEATLTSDMIIGTPQYISPEQALGKRDLDEGTDIYSFGVMLYELTVGKVPFSADTPFSIIHDHIYSPLPLPRQVNPSVTEGVERVLLKTLAKDRKDRYKDVHSLVEAFEHAWREAIAAHPTETLKRGEVPARPTPELPTTLAAGAVSRPGAGTPAPEPIASQVQTRPVARRLGKTAWMWISAAVVLMLGCLVTLWALRSVQRMSPRTTFLPPASQTVQSLPPATESLPSLAQVEAKASDNPGDPSAQLELALAYVTAGLPEKAQQAARRPECLAAGRPLVRGRSRAPFLFGRRTPGRINGPPARSGL